MSDKTPPANTLDEPDAAIYSGFSTHFLRKRRAKGGGPAFIRIGRTIRYRVVDLDSWLEAHRVETRESRRAS